MKPNDIDRFKEFLDDMNIKYTVTEFSHSGLDYCDLEIVEEHISSSDGGLYIRFGNKEFMYFETV